MDNMSAEYLKATQIGTQWIELPYPFKQRSKPLMINDYEYLIMGQEEAGDKCDGLHKFNIKTKKWTKIMDFGHSLRGDQRSRTMNFSSWTLNKNKQLIYVWDRFVPFIIDLNTNTITTKSMDTKIISDSLVFIDNKLHLINGHRFENNPKHTICDEHMSNPKTVHIFDEFGRKFEGNGFIYLSSIQNILLFGGWAKGGSYDLIYSYSILNGQWNKLQLKLPNPLSHFGIVSTRFDEFVIIISGWINGVDPSDDILVYDVKRCILRKSMISCPKSGYCSAIIIDNKYDDQLLLHGFINQCFKLKEFNHVQYLSQDLIQLINKWICNEMIYVLIGSNHWKVSVDHIVCNLHDSL